MEYWDYHRQEQRIWDSAYMTSECAAVSAAKIYARDTGLSHGGAEAFVAAVQTWLGYYDPSRPLHQQGGPGSDGWDDAVARSGDLTRDELEAAVDIAVAAKGAAWEIAKSLVREVEEEYEASLAS